MTVPHLPAARRVPVSAAGLGGPVLVAAAAVASAGLLHLRDPHDSGSYGFCPFLQLTGRPCPGCGGLRAVNDLTRGDLAAAASSNLLVVVAVAAAAILWVVWVARRVGGDRGAPMLRVTTAGGMAVLAVGLAFGVLRLTPWGSWLAP